MRLNFREWLVKEGYTTSGKLGLYPPIEDALGQYPPLYATARIPDVITYIDIAYKGKHPDGKDGIIYPDDHRDGDFNSLDVHRSIHKKLDFPPSLGSIEFSASPSWKQPFKLKRSFA